MIVLSCSVDLWNILHQADLKTCVLVEVDYSLWIKEFDISSSSKIDHMYKLKDMYTYLTLSKKARYNVASNTPCFGRGSPAL